MKTPASIPGKIVQISCLLAAVCAFDWFTPSEVSVGPLYLLVASYAAWQLGFAGGISFAFIGATLWAGGDYLTGHRFSHQWMLYEHCVLRFFTSSLAATAICAYRRTLEAHRRRLAMMERLLSVCPGCGCITVNQAGWRKAAEFHQKPKPLHALCPTCAETHKPDVTPDTARIARD